MFDIVTKTLIAYFDKPVPNFGVSHMALAMRADTLVFT